MTYEISDAERSRSLNLYNGNKLRESISQCKFSPDGKYVLFEDIIYFCETGEAVPLTEGWFNMSTSDWLHTIGDVASIGMDFVIPGSGAFFDVLNAVMYIVEAEYKNTWEEKAPLYVMSAVSFAFVLAPGALQGAIFPLKKFIKHGKIVPGTEKIVAWGMNMVQKSLNRITLGIPKKLFQSLHTGFGRRLVDRFGKEKIEDLVNNKFVKQIQKAFDTVLGTKTLGTAKVGKKIAKEKLTDVTSATMRGYFKRAIKIQYGRRVLKRLGFKKGKKYAVVATRGRKAIEVELLGAQGDNVIILLKNGNKKIMPINEFLEGTVKNPWLLKAKSRSIPTFMRSFARWILPDGSDLDYEAMNSSPDLNPDQTSIESLAFLRDELAEYEGNLGSYTVNTTVTSFQNALMLLGYPLPRAGADGKFGPETQDALKRFQQEINLESNEGRMDRVTAKKLALELRERGIPNSEELQNTLNSI